LRYLNQGAGGYYIYLQGAWGDSNAKGPRSVITEICIISSTNSMSSYTDEYGRKWEFVNFDLNKGAGGKWIYLCYLTQNVVI